jgi:trigger factor
LLDQIDAHHGSVELPEKMVEQEFEAIWREVQRHRERPAGRRRQGQVRRRAQGRIPHHRERRVRLGLVLAEIGRKANVDVTQEELARAVNQEAALSGP